MGFGRDVLVLSDLIWLPCSLYCRRHGGLSCNRPLIVCVRLLSLLVCTGTDPEDVIRNAFACFDEENTGKINEDRLRELLTTMGDRFTDAEV